MKLDTAFIRLPLRVDATRLAAEVEGLPESAWRPHPQGFAGNSAIPLVSVGGDPESDALNGPMLPTPSLAACPYLGQVLASFQAVIGRTRLMRLDGNAEAQRHSDISYYWFDRVRVHVPILTHPDVTFHCGPRDQHMAAGEVWIFDTWSTHGVTNPRNDRRIHLVADTVGSAAFWSMVDAGDRASAADRSETAPAREVAFDPGATPALEFESWNWPEILPPSQMRLAIEQIRASIPAGDARVEAFDRTLLAFAREWSALWARYGDGGEGFDAYTATRARFAAELEETGSAVVLRNGARGHAAARELIVQPALGAPRQVLTPPRAPRIAHPSASNATPSFDRPIFIVCPPRSGSSLLFETLSQSPDVFTIGGESHRAIESIRELHPESHDWNSNHLTADHATAPVVERLEQGFWRELRDRDKRSPASPHVRLLEKTPKNSLRVSFLAAAFPDAYFVYLYRDPRETMSSMLDAWRSGHFATYPDLPGWEGLPWSMLLTPGWRSLIGRPLADIVANQWASAVTCLLDDLEALPPDSWCVASYDRLLSEPQAEIERVCKFVEIGWDRALDGPLPLSRTTLTSPDPEKWRRNASELESMLPIVQEAATRARMLFGTPPATKPVTRSQPVPIPQPVMRARRRGRQHADQAAQTRAAPDFRSVHTTSFVPLLRQLGATLVVTTYQSGRVILVRADGDELNTHLCGFPSPMGVAIAPGRLALGTHREVWEFFDMPAVAKQLKPEGKHDAVYVPRTCIVSGDVRIHELAYARNRLWIANTRFSSLCTLDGTHSFVPRWRPPFVTELAPEDRCHLNGICIADDQIRFVTVLGRTDPAGGWRENKAAGGCILEVPSGRVVAGGLSMPHSPRVHDGRLWVLESGKGELGVFDPAAKQVKPVAKLEGFTRGLAFAGPFAFVGLSQVREQKTFGGLPVTESATDRKCGVWVVDTRTGETVAFLRFEGTVQEIFDVQLLWGARFAELLEPTNELLDGTYAVPQKALEEVPTRLKAQAQ
jgi:uncharacterized protein (TIGR03032 family)